MRRTCNSDESLLMVHRAQKLLACDYKPSSINYKSINILILLVPCLEVIVERLNINRYSTIKSGLFPSTISCFPTFIYSILVIK